MKVSCNVDRTLYDHKPVNWEVGKIQNDLVNPETLDTRELAHILVTGGNMRIVACEGGRGDDDFMTGQMIGIDTDNTITIKGRGKVVSDNPFAPEDVRAVLERNGIAVNFQYPTWSNDDSDVPKFRTIIALNRPVNDIAEYRAILNHCVGLFDEYHADREAETVSRVFFGCKAGEVCYSDYEAVNDVDELLSKCGDIERFKSRPASSPHERKRKKTTSKASDNSVNLRVLQAIKDKDAKYLRKAIAAPVTVVDNRSELMHYIYHELDLSELLGVDPNRTFNCILPGHEDKHPSASVYQNKSGVWLYCCHADCQGTGRGKTNLNIKQFVELIGDFKSEYQSIKFICTIYNIRQQQTTWSKEQCENIDLIMSSLTTGEGADSFYQMCPVASKTTRNALDTYIAALIIAKGAISPQRNAKGNIIFSMSIRQLAKACGKHESKVQAYVKMLEYHHLLESVRDEDVPPRMLARAIEHAHISKNGKRQNHASFYQVPSWVISHILKVEKQGEKWRENNYRLKGVSYEMFARTEPQEAQRLYLMTCKVARKNGDIVDRRPSKASEERHNKISEFVLDRVDTCGYVTEKQILETFANKNLTSKQIARSMQEICDTYGLQKRRANKDLKALYNIEGSGYPNVILRS